MITLICRLSEFRWPRITLLACSGLFCEGALSGGLGSTGRTVVHLSPEVSGVIAFDGVAVEGVQVYRTLDYEKEFYEETLTDGNGAFYFPAKTILSSHPGALLDETRVRQVIGVRHQGESYLLWYHTPGGITERSAVSRRLGSLNCDLTTPEKELLFRNLEKPHFPHAAFSICRWNDGLELESLEHLE